MLCLTPTLAHAATVDVLYTGSLIDATGDASGRTETLSFDAGAIADKLVVNVAGEGGNVATVTYNGTPLTFVAGTGGGRNKGFYYLDNPYTGGAANLSVTLTVTQSNGLAFGVVSLAGTTAGVSASAPINPSTSVSITPVIGESFVFAGHGSNGSSGGASTNAPLTRVYGGANIGSAQGTVGYENGVSAGVHNYSFTSANDSPESSAVAFAPFDDGRIEITDLFATGVNANRVALANGTIGDPHYTLTSVPSGANGNVRVGRGSGVPGAWIGDMTTSAWIGSNDSTNFNSPPGDYTAQTTFTIGSEADLSSVEIYGSWATDNGGLDILLNGSSLVTAGHITGGEISSAFGSFTDFSFGPGVSFFQHGTNTLSFVWNNAGTGSNPGGLRVGYLVGSYLEPQLVPEPRASAH